MNITIRKATLDDAQLLTNIGAETFYEAYCDSTSEEDMRVILTTRFSLQEVTEHLMDHEIENYIAFNDEKDAGYFVIHSKRIPNEMKNENAVELARIYSRKEYWGKKVGKMMMEKTIELARAKKFDVLWLQVWDQNFRAIEFYRRFGFQLRDFRAPFHHGNRVDYDLVMTKNLEQTIRDAR